MGHTTWRWSIDINAEYSSILDEIAPDTATGPRCDDCRKVYAYPDYYTFDSDGCELRIGDDPDPVAHDCTGNLCPECAGPHLEPDDPADPRRPADG